MLKRGGGGWRVVTARTVMMRRGRSVDDLLYEQTETTPLPALLVSRGGIVSLLSVISMDSCLTEHVY